jgi:hypothetical protein
MHNKSGLNILSFLKSNDNYILQRWNDYKDNYVEVVQGPIWDNPCWLTSSQDGRAGGDKFAYAYELAAFSRYGRWNLEKVPPRKSKDSLTISHICGWGPRCCNPHHLVLEPKWMNDERTHCHWALHNAWNYGGYHGLQEAYYLRVCPHYPACCYVTWW